MVEGGSTLMKRLGSLTNREGGSSGSGTEKKSTGGVREKLRAASAKPVEDKAQFRTATTNVKRGRMKKTVKTGSGGKVQAAGVKEATKLQQQEKIVTEKKTAATAQKKAATAQKKVMTTAAQKKTTTTTAQKKSTTAQRRSSTTGRASSRASERTSVRKVSKTEKKENENEELKRTIQGERKKTTGRTVNQSQNQNPNQSTTAPKKEKSRVAGRMSSFRRLSLAIRSDSSAGKGAGELQPSQFPDKEEAPQMAKEFSNVTADGSPRSSETGSTISPPQEVATHEEPRDSLASTMFIRAPSSLSKEGSRTPSSARRSSFFRTGSFKALGDAIRGRRSAPNSPTNKSTFSRSGGEGSYASSERDSATRYSSISSRSSQRRTKQQVLATATSLKAAGAEVEVIQEEAEALVVENECEIFGEDGDDDHSFVSCESSEREAEEEDLEKLLAATDRVADRQEGAGLTSAPVSVAPSLNQSVDADFVDDLDEEEDDDDDDEGRKLTSAEEAKLKQEREDAEVERLVQQLQRGSGKARPGRLSSAPRTPDRARNTNMDSSKVLEISTIESRIERQGSKLTDLYRERRSRAQSEERPIRRQSSFNPKASSTARILAKGLTGDLDETTILFGGAENMLDYLEDSEQDQNCYNDPVKRSMKFQACRALIGDLLQESNVYDAERVNKDEEE